MPSRSFAGKNSKNLFTVYRLLFTQYQQFISHCNGAMRQVQCAERYILISVCELYRT